jgi:hypothetical protein
VEGKKDKANIVDAVEWRVMRSSERPTICNLRLEKPTVLNGADRHRRSLRAAGQIIRKITIAKTNNQTKVNERRLF